MATFTGYNAESYADIFYNQIWLIEDSLDFSDQTTGYTANVYIWNSYFTAKNLSTVATTNMSNVAVLGTDTTKSFAALEQTTYTILLSSSVPITIDGYLTFIFSDAEDPVLKISGILLQVFSYQPDWVDGITENLEYATRILTANNGQEQAHRLRTYPRISYTYNSLLIQSTDHKDNALLRARFHNQIMKNYDKKWLLPIWADAYSLLQNFTSGTNVVSVPTATRDFYVGQSVMLYNKWNDYDLFTVSSISPTALTLSTNASKTWKAGQAYVIPTRTATINSDTTSFNLQTYALENNTIVWNLLVENIQASTKYAAYNPTYTYKGYDVYTREHNFDSDVTVTINANQRLLDFVTGIYKIQSGFKINRHSYIKESYQFNYLLKTRSEYIEFLGFLRQRAGRWKPCWIPTYSNEIQIVAADVSSSQTLRIKDIGYSLYIKAAINRRDITLIDSSNTYRFYRIIDAVNNFDGTETLTLDSPVGLNFTPSTFSMGCFMRFCRLADDTAVIKWETDEFATTSLSFIESISNPV
jgi:hypothetical protein